MIYKKNFKKLSFLVYGLGLTGKSVINFFIKNKIKNYYVWDDYNKNSYLNRRPHNLAKILKEVNYIVLSPGVSLKKSKHKKKLQKFKNKIITDLDLIYLLRKDFKTIVVTGTNGKSTTCKIIYHVLKKNKFNVLLGGNFGTPVLQLSPKKNNFLIIEASSYQLSHSKFLKPDFAVLLNITNDHLDWHGSMREYVNSKLKIFRLQTKSQFSIINKKFVNNFKIKKFSGKIIIPNKKIYLKFKNKIKNAYVKSTINDENVSNVLALSKLLKINEKSLLQSLNTFKGLKHRYEIFLQKKNTTFINDSKATSFEATKFALQNSNNIFWIVGGLPKKNDKIILGKLKNKIIKSYIIGKKINFFKKQIQKNVSTYVAKNLRNSIIRILKDIKLFKKENNTILLSPAAASFDQYLNFEKRGNHFKKLSRLYANKFI